MPLQRVFCMTNRTAQKAVKVAVGLLLLRGLLEEDIYFLAGVCLPFSLLMEGK